MATNRTDSLIGTGGDYTTIQSWEDDIGVGLGSSTNLVTDDYDHYGWLKAQQFDENVVISGHTTNATHRIYLAADSNGGTTTASQHGGTKTDAALMDDDTRALAYNSSYASMLANDGYAYGLDVVTEYCHISRLQFKKTAVNNYGARFATNTHIERCLFEGYRTSGSYYPIQFSSGYVDVHSSIIISTGIALRQLNNYGNIINTTFVRSSGSPLSATATQAYADYGRPVFENCAFFSGGAGTNYVGVLGGTAFTTFDYCATDHSDLTSASGEGSNNTYSLTASDQFTALNNTDWSLKAGNDLDTGGVDRTSTAPKDIWGNDFNAGDIGCEASAAGGGVTGAGDLVGAGSEVVGTGTRTVTGAGTLEGQGAAVVGTGERVITGTGALIGQGSDVAGTGATGGVHTGTGDLIGAGSEVVGVGERTITGTGVLVAQGSAVVGVGERTVTGSGDLVGAGAEVSGTGAVGGITTGTGDLVGAGSEVVGTGVRTVTGTGALVAQGSAVTGTGERTITGAGALIGSGSEIVGTGIGGDVTTGAGALVGQGSAVTGTGTRKITGVGELVAAGSIIVGAGARTITGSGTLVGAGTEVSGSSAYTHDFIDNNGNTWTLGPRGRVWQLENRNPYDAHKRGREVCS